MHDLRNAGSNPHLRLTRRALGGLGVGLVAGALVHPEPVEARAGRGRNTSQNATSPLSRRGLTATALPGGLVLVAGGIQSSPTSAVQLYDPQQDQWYEAAPMNGPRYHHAAAPLPDGRVLVCGGQLLQALSTAEIYDPHTDTWTLVAPMNVSRTEHAAAALDGGGVLVTGGSNSAPLSSSEVYQPGADRWIVL